jgi:polysaccharide pyruvyl transferase WcaK-like protein
MEAVLGYLRADHPEAILDAMCGGASQVGDRYGLPAVPLFWYQKYDQRVSGAPAIALKILGKGVDVFRTAAWVQRHDVVIVPGMGVLEASLPLRPWGFPYALLLLSASGRLFGTKIALVSVGAGVIRQPLTRWLFNNAARLASYRSYRNVGSREAMRDRGLDTANDPVYPDLAFALPAPPDRPGDAQTVCVGVMDYHGSNDDRRRAGEIYSAYVTEMKHFVRWLVDSGRRVRLLVGDTNGSDGNVVQEILADLRISRPGLDASWVAAEPVTSFADIMRAMQPASTVVAIRFHNVLAALKLGKPTIAISYSPKHEALMKDMGLPAYCLPVTALDLDSLARQFTRLQSNTDQIRRTLMERNAANEQLLSEQFAALWTAFFPRAGESRPGRRPAPERQDIH